MRDIQFRFKLYDYLILRKILKLLQTVINRKEMHGK